ncbi:MAG TPA: hypothetical protein ENJ95_20525 [Bacteroidetes bacterium]|nr:hypothetical protein [Bacteroidota bacterium]
MKKPFLKQTTFFFLFIVLLGCAKEPSSKASGQTVLKKYFDLKGFLENEVKRLSTKTAFTKTAFINDEREEKKVENIDLENELKIFSDSDINRPAWSDKYEIDSTFQDGKLAALHYRTDDKKLKTKDLKIDFKEGEVSKIQIKNVSNTAIANTQQSLIYEPAKGYSIESKQDVAMIDEKVFRIEVSFK